mgnify:CR=1 FL=1
MRRIAGIGSGEAQATLRPASLTHVSTILRIATGYCGLIPAALITRPHFSVSARI